MSDKPFDDVVALALQLSPVEQARLMERLALAMREALTASDAAETETPWTDAEIAAMMTLKPLTGAEIVAAGLTGGWEDINITDGAEWVNAQKRKRQERRRW
jgi:hypothetical protein